MITPSAFLSKLMSHLTQFFTQGFIVIISEWSSEIPQSDADLQALIHHDIMKFI